MIAQVATGIINRLGTYQSGLIADAGTNTTTLIDSAGLTSSVDDYYNGWYVNFGGAISMISDYDGTTKTATLQTALTGFKTGSVYNLSSTLICAYTGMFWRDEAKQGVSFPYCVFTIIDGQRLDTFTEKMEYYRIQFTLWHKYSGSISDAKASLDVLESALNDLFDNAILTISGWSCAGMINLGNRPAFSEDEDIVGVIVEYVTYITQIT